jgi:hypothetical protein
MEEMTSASDAVWNHAGIGRRQGVAHLLVSRNHVSFSRRFHAHVAQLVEHVLGKDEVTGSIPVVSSLGEF